MATQAERSGRRGLGRGMLVAITALATALLTSAVWLVIFQSVADDAPEARRPVAPAPAAPAPAPAPTRAALLLPVEGGRLLDTFGEARDGGARPHTGVDIMAPHGAPVRAVAPGRVAKLFTSARGGLTVYQYDATGRIAYYYAHLEGYAPGLTEGVALAAGDPIGFVGTTGSAQGGEPHLHFEVLRLAEPNVWYRGTPVDPYPLLAAR